MLAQEVGYEDGANYATNHVFNQLIRGDFVLPITKEAWPYTANKPCVASMELSSDLTNEFAKRLLDLWYQVGIEDGLSSGYDEGYRRGISDLLTFFNESTSVHQVSPLTLVE